MNLWIHNAKKQHSGLQKPQKWTWKPKTQRKCCLEGVQKRYSNEATKNTQIQLQTRALLMISGTRVCLECAIAKVFLHGIWTTFSVATVERRRGRWRGAVALKTAGPRTTPTTLPLPAPLYSPRHQVRRKTSMQKSGGASSQEVG